MRYHPKQRRPHRRPEVLPLEERTVLSLIGGEAFDGVLAPALPTGWTAQIVSGAPVAWATSTTTPPDAPPNAAFAAGPGSVADNLLISPVYNIPASGVTRLGFVQTFSLEDTFDGGVLEISINGGTFTDLVAAGGSFVEGGYTGTIATSFSSPIGGRSAWTGTAAAPLTTVATLPGSASGSTAQFRWRLGSDDSVASEGWRIDTVTLSQPADLSITTSVPTFVTSRDSPLLQTIVVTNLGPNPAAQVELSVPHPGGLTVAFGGSTGAWSVFDVGSMNDPFFRIGGLASLAPGASATVRVRYDFLAQTADRIYPFSAEVGSATFDPIPANNAAAATSVANSTLSPPTPLFAQDFDGVTAPTLPADWTSTIATGSSGWITTDSVSDSPPNAAFVPNADTVSDIRLTSPGFTLPTGPGLSQLTFRHRYEFEEGGFDGGVLEVSSQGGAFRDVTQIGSSFATGGYNGTISSDFDNPLGGRMGWVNTTDSEFLTTTVNLPRNLNGRTVQFRWRLGTDISIGATGWHVDSFRLEAVGRRTDLGVSVAAGSSVISAAEPTTFTITATNPGPIPANDAVVTVPIDRGSTFVGATAPAGWTINGPVRGLLTFSRPLFAPGSAVFTVTAIVPALATGSNASASLRASIASSVPDPDVTNNTAVAASRVIGLAPLATSAGSTPQTASVGSAFAVPLGVRLLDQLNSPITGVPITFTAPSSGASGTFPGMLSSVVVLTDANGFAIAPALTANATRGSYSIVATAPGGASASFALANLGLITGSFVNFGPAFEDVSTGPVAVATFSDPEALAAGSYTASIDWFGDGSVITPGTVGGVGGAYVVIGSFTYANPGTFAPEVTLTDAATGRSVTLAGSVPVTRDINSAVEVTRSPLSLISGTNVYKGTIRIKNTSGNAIAGPLRLVISGLAAGAMLLASPGTSLLTTPAGLPYLLLNLSSPLGPGATVNLTVRFSRPTPGPISYNVSAFADA